MKASEFSVIIPQYGCWEQTVHCCASLLRFHSEPLELLIIDDGSPAEDLRLASQYLPRMARILSQPHQGVTAAWNLGLRSSQAPYVVLLNNDVVTRRAWLPGLKQILNRNPCALAGGAWYSSTGQLQLQQKLNLEFLSQRLLAGWCFGFCREAACQIGELDETMKLYWSDTDWQLRWLEYHAGRAGLLQRLPGSPLWHQGHVTVKKMLSGREQWKQDRQTFLKKWKLRSQQKSV